MNNAFPETKPKHEKTLSVVGKSFVKQATKQTHEPNSYTSFE